MATSSSAVVLALAPASALAATVERRLAVMGTSLTVEVDAGDRAAALAATEAAVRAIEAAERRLSTWSADTELARLNRAAVGERTGVSGELAGELSSALACAAATGGSFDPTLGAMVAAWGLRSGGRQPPAAKLAAARARTGWTKLRVEGREAVRLADVAVEEGGFGKGAALDRAAAALTRERVTAAHLDLGGQALALGRRWVPLAHPEERDLVVAEVLVEDGSLATSGNSERAVAVGGLRIGHLLDPRSGRPVAHAGAVTVLAPSALRADCLSTALFVMGEERAFAWARRHPGIEVLVSRVERGRVLVRATAGLRDRLRPRAPAVAIAWVPAGDAP